MLKEMEQPLEGRLRERIYGIIGTSLVGFASGSIYARFVLDSLQSRDVYYNAGLVASVVGGAIIGRGAGMSLIELQTKGVPLPRWLFRVLP